MELMETIETRRAYRSLGPVEIDESLVRELATAASLSASCFNKQPWRYVFAYDKKVLSRLQGAMNKGNEWTKAASLIIAVTSRKDMDCLVEGKGILPLRHRHGHCLFDPAGHGTRSGRPSHRRIR